MEVNQSLADVLNDLVKINNDRIAGYEKALAQAGDDDIDLKAIFSRMADESRKYLALLSQEITNLGAELAPSGSSVTGRIYQAWRDVTTAIAGSSRLSMLESCEHLEDATQHAYQIAQVSEETIPILIRQLIANQQLALKESHDTIKRYRDMHRKAGADDILSSDALRSSQKDLRNEQSLS